MYYILIYHVLCPIFSISALFLLILFIFGTPYFDYFALDLIILYYFIPFVRQKCLSLFVISIMIDSFYLCKFGLNFIILCLAHHISFILLSIRFLNDDLYNVLIFCVYSFFVIVMRVIFVKSCFYSLYFLDYYALLSYLCYTFFYYFIFYCFMFFMSKFIFNMKY